MTIEITNLQEQLYSSAKKKTHMFSIVQVFTFESFGYNCLVFTLTCIQIHCHCLVLVHQKILVSNTIFHQTMSIWVHDSQGWM